MPLRSSGVANRGVPLVVSPGFCHIARTVKLVATGVGILLALLGLRLLVPSALEGGATPSGRGPAGPVAAPALPTSPPTIVPTASGPGHQPVLRPSLQPGGEIFDQPTVLDFHLQLDATNLAALENNPREYTPVTATVNGVEFPRVAIKLKGAAGSFRPVDDRPAMTVAFHRDAPGRRLFGLRRLHLNNSVQDPTFLNEYVGSELFRAAGVPTPRVAWATVRLNKRDLGLYVLKEAFEREFLRSFFPYPDGNLYEGGFVRDIDRDLDRESGLGPADGSDLRALADAAQERDAGRRWERLTPLLDVERFATYAALSVMLADWDGYPLNRNNYRVYFDPADGRAVFLPHGMDQLLQRTYLDLDPGWAGQVAWAVFSTDPGQALYEARCREVFQQVFTFGRVSNLVTRAAAALTPVRPDMPGIASSYLDQVTWRLRTLRRDPILKPSLPTEARAAR